MSKLPSSEKVIKVLLENGFYLKSQRGSHAKYSDGNRIVIVTSQRKEIPIGTLKSISRQSAIDFDLFINL